MDFNDTPEEAKFRQEAQQWLTANIPDKKELAGLDTIAAAKLWQKRKYDAGWACITWPEAHGGRGATPIENVIWGQEEGKYNTPENVFSIGHGMCAPTMMAWATEEQNRKYLPRLASGEDIWCQLFSEPAGGSDLAAMRTRAEKDGDEWVINGQKIWTSGAHVSDWGWLAARTDPDAPKHKGITMFMLRMDTPGITVRPLINMAEGHGFNEVFFEDVRIPKSNVVGETNRGWYHLAVALDFERSGIGAFAGGRRTVEEITDFARDNRHLLDERPAARYELAERAIEVEVGTYMAYRIAYMQEHGVVANHEASMSKLFGSELGQRIAKTGMDLLGLRGNVWSDGPYAALQGRLSRSYVSAVSGTIAAGTSEIQRNIIATRGLGLPRG